MTEQLKPCPACGGSRLTVRSYMPQNFRLDDKYYVRCKCKTSGPYCDTEAAAIAAWNSLPRALRWTHEPPTVAGWYWWRWAKFQEHMCLYVRDGLIVEYPHKQLRSVAEIGGQWSDGPIQAPAEPEES